MSIPHVPNSMSCANCGETSPVVMSARRQGEQLVIARMEGRYYVTIFCPNCGNVQQEIDDQPASPKTDALQIGDWVRTASGLDGKIVLLSRLSAFIDYRDKSASYPASCPLSELTKIDPPKPDNISTLSQ